MPHNGAFNRTDRDSDCRIYRYGLSDGLLVIRGLNVNVLYKPLYMDAVPSMYCNEISWVNLAVRSEKRSESEGESVISKESEGAGCGRVRA